MPFLPPPPLRLYLMRHAQSGWALPGQTDFDRTLDETGREEAADVAARAARRGYRPDIILASSARRCRDTAALFLEAFADRPEIHFSNDLYNAPPLSYFEMMTAHRDRPSLMLIGHNPAMEEILERLAGPRAAAEAAPDGYPTAGFAVLSHDGQKTGGSDDVFQLTEFLTR